ncbi:unnamed protein product [Ascophyllum nodosum]
MRSATCVGVVAILGIALIGLIALQLFLDVGGPRKGQKSVRPHQSVGGGSAAVVDNEGSVPPTPAPFHAFDPVFEDGVLKKQAFSSRMRFVFLVGLEGTGHHYMFEVLERMCQTGQAPCPNLCPLGKVVYPVLTNPETEHDYKDARKRLRREMQKLALLVEELPEGKTVVTAVGTCPGSGIGMMSYPNYDGPSKALQHVDLQIFAEETERAGIDLRIIYLARAAKPILISDTKHNKYGGTFMMEARVLMSNAAVMESFFHEIDPAFTTCFRYENITSDAQAERVSRFVAPTEYSAGRLAGMMLSAAKTPLSHPGHMRSRRLRAHGALEGSEYWPEAMDDAWPGSGGTEAKEVERSATIEGWRARGGHRRSSEKLTEAQEMMAVRLQRKLDILERELCSW